MLGGCSAEPAAAQPRTARGVLVDVQSATPGIQQVDRFTLRGADGQELTFVPAADFNVGVAHAMTPGHMRQHMARAEAVTVTYRDERGKLVAISATD